MLLLKGKHPEHNKGYDYLVSVVSDRLLCAKFNFVEVRSREFNNFPKDFKQTIKLSPFFFCIRWIYFDV